MICPVSLVKKADDRQTDTQTDHETIVNRKRIPLFRLKDGTLRLCQVVYTAYNYTAVFIIICIQLLKQLHVKVKIYA